MEAPALLRFRFWFNLTIKSFVVLFSYINFLPIPWRLAILHHLTCTRRSCVAGCDFYGRPTNAMWFNLPVRTRRWIALWLNLAYIMHFVCLMEHIVYQSFLEGQTWPGGFAQNLPFVLSMIAAMTGGILQSKAEDALIDAVRHFL